MDQSARTSALDAFRKGDATLLIASDVAARGLDIPDVSHVFNFDVPHHPDDYVHRIGRTGRAGRTGTAVTIVAPADTKAVGIIERLIGQTIPWSGEAIELRDGEPVPSPERRGRNGRTRSKRPERAGTRASQRPKAPIEQPQTSGAHKVAALRPQRRHDHDNDDAAVGHLPAFLLRPVPVKA
jgi:superfamily II DNA/RNA helicase